MRKTLIMLILIILLIPLKTSAEFLKVQVTAYCSCPLCTGKTSSSPAYGITKSGISVFDNPYVIAAHPKILPQGSIVFIDGVGFRLTADTGSFMYWKDGNKVVDLYMPSHQDALNWGRQLKTLLVIRWGWDKWTDVEIELGGYEASANKLGVGTYYTETLRNVRETKATTSVDSEVDIIRGLDFTKAWLLLGLAVIVIGYRQRNKGLLR